MMADLDTTVAVYGDAAAAEADWSLLEAAADEKAIDIADAALVENQEGEAVIVQRQSRHGWGKGAVVGAVVGVLFPPSILGAAVVGAGGGALVARMSRALGRSKVKDLGEVLDAGSMAIVVVAPTESTEAVTAKLNGAQQTVTRTAATVEELQEALRAGT
jgi:uncharacterized membrane protein